MNSLTHFNNFRNSKKRKHYEKNMIHITCLAAEWRFHICNPHNSHTYHPISHLESRVCKLNVAAMELFLVKDSLYNTSYFSANDQLDAGSKCFIFAEENSRGNFVQLKPSFALGCVALRFTTSQANEFLIITEIIIRSIIETIIADRIIEWVPS